MLTKEEQFDVAMDVIHRIAPEMMHQIPSRPTSREEGASPLQDNNRQYQPAVSRGFNLRQILKRIGPLPAYSALIGQCSDGLPFLLDLSDPTPGSILISGAQFSGKTAILRTILASAAMLNSPHQVNFIVLSPNCGELDAIGGYPHNRGMISTYDRASTEQVIRLTEIAEQRKSGRNRGATIVLGIDNLETMLQYREHELQSYLRWLVRNGPRLNIWPVATINPANISEKDYDLISEFGTHLSDGSTRNQLQTGRIRGAANLSRQGQFTANVAGETFGFSALDTI